jgi:hypothetical protein
MNGWRDKLFAYRERFRTTDRRWHFLVGSQLLFVMAVIRFRLAKEKQDQINITPSPISSSSSAGQEETKGKQ